MAVVVVVRERKVVENPGTPLVVSSSAEAKGGEDTMNRALYVGESQLGARRTRTKMVPGEAERQLSVSDTAEGYPAGRTPPEAVTKEVMLGEVEGLKEVGEGEKEEA